MSPYDAWKTTPDDGPFCTAAEYESMRRLLAHVESEQALLPACCKDEASVLRMTLENYIEETQSTGVFNGGRFDERCD